MLSLWMEIDQCGKGAFQRQEYDHIQLIVYIASKGSQEAVV
jgi:hypothetical protein